MRSRSRMGFAVLAVAGASALPAAADRPSLLALDAKLDQVVDGLCAGDPGQCGTPAPAVAGQLDLDGGAYVLDFTSVEFEVQSPGPSFAFAPLRVVLDTADVTSQLLDPLLSTQVIPDVEVVVPNPQGPGSVVVLRLLDVTLDSLEVGSEGSLGSLELGFTAAQLDWLGSQSSWDDDTASGTGCTVPSGEKHVALAGNDPSLVVSGDVEATFAFGVTPFGRTFSYARDSAASTACYLRTLGQGGDPMQPSFRRLSPLSDTFGTQLHAETIDVGTASIASFVLRIDATGVRDAITLEAPLTGTLTTRAFDPGTGQEIQAVSTPF